MQMLRKSSSQFQIRTTRSSIFIGPDMTMRQTAVTGFMRSSKGTRGLGGIRTQSVMNDLAKLGKFIEIEDI